MPIPALTREQSRHVDRVAIDELGFSGLVLMENAGRNMAHDLDARLAPESRVAICCGTGNNGGDGFVMARHLANRGHTIVVLTAGDTTRFSPDARANFDLLADCEVEVVTGLDDVTRHKWFGAVLRTSHWIVDALLGTGVSEALRTPWADVVALLNAAQKPIFSCDVPTGLDCDTGQPLGTAIRASVTATCVTPKVGFDAEGANEFLGELVVIDIGIPRGLLTREEFTS